MIKANFELWKPLEDFEKFYEISTWGRIKSKYTKGKILKNQINRNGYVCIILHKHGDYYHFENHRLVAKNFIPNPNNYPCVNHKDENPKNPRRDNLEWCTFKYNTNYGTSIERRVKHTDFNALLKKAHSKEAIIKRAKSQSKTVYQYDKQLNLIKVWQSASECARNGFNQGHISACCRKDAHFKTHKGYIWSYTKLD